MITIGKGIYSILSQNTGVTHYVSTHIFPLITPEVINLPCVIYERQGNEEGSKDGHGIYDSQVYITTIAMEYETSVNIAQACLNALEGYSGTAGGTSFIRIRFVTANETYQEDVFLQRLTFDVKSR
jgi:hypothetical protein